MSDDEIRFDDVTYREPHKLKRLDLDRRVVSIPYQIPSPDDLLIFLDRKPADLIERHSLRDTSVELGGILLGKECLDEESGRSFVWVTEALEAKHYENTQASFTYTHDSWEEITRERDAKHPDLDIVGWYHTHPDFGIFLSSHDLFIHHNFFAQPLQVAYVVDPIRQTRGFFQWRDGQMAQVGGFYLTAGRAERLQVARLVNELEGIPNADGGGGGSGLSPRLEAELFAMLSRPQTVAVAADRGQTAAVFMLLGVLMTSLVFAGAMWLQALGRGMNEQTKAIEELAKAQKESSGTTARAIDAERNAARAEALETVLKEVKADPANASPRVIARLTEAIAERDDARRKFDRLRVEKEAMTDRAASSEERACTAQSKLDDFRREKAEAEKEALAAREKDSADIELLKTRLEDADKLLKDSSVGDLVKKYTWAFYLAIAGWVGFLACGVGLGMAYARHVVESEGSAPEPPRHTIT